MADSPFRLWPRLLLALPVKESQYARQFVKMAQTLDDIFSDSALLNLKRKKKAGGSLVWNTQQCAVVVTTQLLTFKKKLCNRKQLLK